MGREVIHGSDRRSGAGQEAQVDFGKLGLVFDPETGKTRPLWALLVALVFSCHPFVWPTCLQTTEIVCEGLDPAWMFFGGIVVTLIPDNTKAMVNDRAVPEPALVRLPVRPAGSGRTHHERLPVVVELT